MSAPAGAAWPGYEILGPLGRGGMGTVYRARHAGLDRDVAVKVLAAADAASPEARRRFLAEARALARITHPHVVQVHDVMEHGELCAFAMELVPGCSLAELLEAVARAAPAERLVTAARTLAAASPGPVALDAAHRSWVRFVVCAAWRVAEALAVVHRAGLVHRDVKPANILLRADGTALLADFGLARDLLAGARAARTLTGQFLGTLAYAAPEQLRSSGRADARCDIYALGATLYHALALRLPFAGDHPSRVLARIEAGALPPLHRVDRSVRRDLSRVVGQAMDPDPARRYQDASTFAADLANVLALRPVGARAPGMAVRLQRARARHPVGSAAVLTALCALAISGPFLLVALQARAASTRAALDRPLVAGLLVEAETLSAGGTARTAALRRWLAQARALLPRAIAGDTPLAEPPLRPVSGAEASLDRTRAACARALLDGPSPPANSAMVRDWVHMVEARVSAGGRANGGGDFAVALAELVAAERRLAGRLTDALEAERRYQQALADSWPRAIQEVADVARCPRLGGLVLVPQPGLVPLGADPDSGLMEFAHLQTGQPPERDAATGRLRVQEDSGVVLVLLPGGKTQVGSRAPEPGEEDGVGYADSSTHSAVDEVTLAPFFLARTEMTQAQWLRVTGRNPSWFAVGMRVDDHVVDGRHPVESVLHEEAEQVLERLDLVLPTVAQWEYGARGGTTSRYWTGAQPSSMAGAENVHDQSHARRTRAGSEATGPGPSAAWDDGWPLHAPVGSLRPNPFGLHDVLGNVAELCRELVVHTRHRVKPRDGEGEWDRVSPGSWQPMTRGGAFDLGLFEARVASGIGRSPGLRDPGVGLRPSRSLRR